MILPGAAMLTADPDHEYVRLKHVDEVADTVQKPARLRRKGL